jgi:hypothetical protein
MSEESKSPRFLKLDDVAEELNTTHNQISCGAARQEGVDRERVVDVE